MKARSRRAADPEYQYWLGRPLRDVDYRGLAALEVPPYRVNWHRGAFDPLLRDAVVFRRGQRFDFLRHLRGEDVEPIGAYTLLACDAGGRPIDVVAWHPRTARLATWLGHTGLLGEDYPSPATSEDPLTVYPDPAAWLAAERRGVVVVGERLARLALLEAGAIQASDIDHGTKLKAMLERVRLPRIVVPTTAIGRVAA